jgi:hydroxylaminobenzene mutase
MESTGRRLMFHGMVLFLLGLGTGFAEQHFANGIFLLALGASWKEVRLTSRTASVVFWVTLYGTYGNWLMTTLAAVFGTAALSPITGAGHSGLPWQESLVMVGFMTVGITMVFSSAVVLWGLRARGLP